MLGVVYRCTGSRDTQLPSPQPPRPQQPHNIPTYSINKEEDEFTLENGLFSNCLVIYDRMAPLDLKLCSSFINWIINPRLGLTFLVSLICLRVFTRDQFLLIMSAAVSTVADRLSPTRQLITTRPPEAARALEMKSAAGWK